MNWAACALIGAAAWPAPDDRPAAPADAARAALADARRLDPAAARHARYLSAAHVPAAERAELAAVLGYHVNAVSREGVVVRPKAVAPGLWRVDLRDYRIDPTVFAEAVFGPKALEPYFHATVDLGGKTVVASAPWLPAGVMAELVQRTGSETPVVRADWFLNRTMIQEGRDGHGYFDLLGLKTRADAEKLAGLDRRLAEAIFREQAGVVVASGVALQGRQLFRYATVAGSWWESRDTKGDEGSRAARNEARLLLDDFRHDAEEIVFTLPNRLPGYYLSDAAGGQVRSAPPDIATDHRSGNNDRRVHAAMSCVRCHTAGGLIPFDDHARRLYAAGTRVALGAADDVRLRRLRSVYLGPIERAFQADAREYAAAIADACGLTPGGLSAAVGRQWARYLDEPVTAARAAAECGLTEADFLRLLRAAADRDRLADPVLAAYLTAPDPGAVRREHFEEAFPLLMQLLGNPGAAP